MTLAEHQKVRKLFEDPISFSLEYPSVFMQFYNWRFFVDTDTDELAVFRYFYNKDIVFNNDYHLILVNTPQQELSSGFIEPVVKHINQTICSKDVKLICIEWKGYNILNAFESFIHPLFNRAKKLCKVAGVELLGQIEVKLSNNSIIHNKLYHNKGVPTYENTLHAIQHIITRYPEYRLRLYVDAFPSDSTAMEIFLKQFGDIVRKHIHLRWNPHKTKERKEEENSKVDFFQNRLNEDLEEINPEQTYPLLAPRKNLTVIYPDKNVYMSIPPDFPEEKHAQGILNEADGIIQWNEAEREKRLSQLWFEKKQCISCKHLPLYARVCPLLKMNAGIVCPVENKLIDLETVIVKEFESKLQ